MFRISGLTTRAHDCAVRFFARLSLTEYGPLPCVTRYASPARMRVGTPGRAARIGQVAPRRKAHRSNPAKTRGPIRMGGPPSFECGWLPGGTERDPRRPRPPRG